MVKRDKYLVKLSKPLRSKQTLWEIKLWRYLRAGRFEGCKFKRQVVIKNYVVDFCCNDKKLIIELDGSYHQFSEKDKLRDNFFKDLGYSILRFWNNEIDKNLNGVLEKVREKCNEKS